MTEEWRGIPGFSGRYEVSNLGRARSLAELRRYIHWRTGVEMFRQTKTKLLAQQITNSGYLLVQLFDGETRKAATVHRLVAFAFCPGHFEGADVNHKDGDKTNNTPANLEWVTRLGNNLHAVHTGLNIQAVPVIDPATGIRYDSIAQAAKGARKSHRKVAATFIRVKP